MCGSLDLTMSDIEELFEGSSSPTATKSEDASLEAPSSHDKEALPMALKRHRFPPTSKRLYFPIIPGAGGHNCLPLASTGISAVSFFKTLPRDALRVPVNQVVQTSHENLVNVQELYLSPHSVVLTYDSWGISLLEICRIYNIFANDASAVSTICKEVLIRIFSLWTS